MMRAQELISVLRERGVKLWLENGKIRFHARSRDISEGELNHLRSLKAEVADILQRIRSLSDVPLVGRLPGCVVPLTSMLRRAWDFRSARLARQRTCVTAMSLHGVLDTMILSRCIDVLPERHEILRTRFVASEDIPAQITDPSWEYHLDTADLSGASAGDVRAEAVLQAKEFLRQEVSLDIGPLFAAKLFKLSLREHVLILALNHMISDAISNEILNRELWTLYKRGLRGEELSLPGPPLQFADYAVWQQQTFASWRDEHETYWRSRLGGLPPSKLPFSIDLPQTNEATGEEVLTLFGEDLSLKLRHLARAQRTMVALVAFAIFTVALSCWCNQQEPVVTFVINGRNRWELREMIGFVASHVYLRIKIRGADVFTDLLEQVHAEFNCAIEHHDFDRVADFIPEFKTELYFNWSSTIGSWLKTGQQTEISNDLTMEPFACMDPMPLRFSPFFNDTGRDIILAIRYAPVLCSRHEVERFSKGVLLFARRVVENPSIPLLDLMENGLEG